MEFYSLGKSGDIVKAADWLGNVKENWLDHKIMVPFKWEGDYTVVSVANEGEYTIKDTIAVLKDDAGEEHPVTMVQKWPVKVAVRNYVDKPRPFRQMETGVRVIDTMNPMLEGALVLFLVRSGRVKRCCSMLWLVLRMQM